jgi:hypothetical protein
MTILRWGSYQHDQDEVGVRIQYRAVMDEFGRRMADIHTWHILGAKHVPIESTHEATQANVTSALTSLEMAYLQDYQNLQLFLNNGAPTRHNMFNFQMFGGTHVMAFGYMDGPWKMRTEYANMRTFYAIVQGEERYGSGLYSWNEKLTIKGTGGPKFLYMPQMVGPPIPQIVQTDTTFYYIQEGRAVGRKAYIIPPDPLYPGIEHLDQRVITYGTPLEYRFNKAAGTFDKEKFVTQWRYVMEATSAQGFESFPDPNTAF